MKLTRFIIKSLWVVLLPLSLTAQTSHAYLLQEADDYFKAGRYWDAFFKYRECANLPEFVAENKIAGQIETSSHALYLTKKFKDYFALHRYEPAKSNLIELIMVNPADPNRGELPRITLAQGAELQRLAWRQASPEATAAMLRKAILFYHQAIREGLMDESIETTIKQCEFSIKETKVPDNGPVIASEPVQNTQTISTEIAPKATTIGTPRKPSVIIFPTPAPKEN